DERKKAFEQQLIQIAATKRRPDRCADQAAALSEDRDGMLVAVRRREQRLLRGAALVPQRLQLPGVDAVPLVLEAPLGEPCERQIHVVAAEENVIADRDALEREIAVALAHQNQAEVGRAAADVADQHEVADAELAPPPLARALDPCIARGLRLLEQRDVRETRSLGGPQ